MHPPTTLDEFAHLVGDDPMALRFLAKVKMGPVPPWAPHLGPCIMWTAATETTGYGTFRGIDPPWEAPANPKGMRVRQRNAHIWAFERLNGRKVRPGYELDHLCHDWRFCIPEEPRLDPHRRCVIHPREKTVAENRLRANTVPGNNSRRSAAVKAGVSPVWCTCETGPHDLSLPENQYWAPKTNSLKCQAGRRNAGAKFERKKRALAAQAG